MWGKSYGRQKELFILWSAGSFHRRCWLYGLHSGGYLLYQQACVHVRVHVCIVHVCIICTCIYLCMCVYDMCTHNILCIKFKSRCCCCCCCLGWRDGTTIKGKESLASIPSTHMTVNSFHLLDPIGTRHLSGRQTCAHRAPVHIKMIK